MQNHQNIKVSDAIKTGIRKINIPIYSIFVLGVFIIPAILMYVYRNDKNNVVFIVLSVSSMLLGIILPFIWWGIATVKYKIWAGKNVKDIHRFQEIATSKYLIDDLSFMRKFQISSEKQKKELKKFYQRLNNDKELIIDFNNHFGKEIIFKQKNIFSIILLSVFLIAVVYLYKIQEVNLRYTLVIGIALGFMIILEIYKRFKYNYLLKINRDKISYKDDKKVILWKEIESYYIIPRIGYTSAKLTVKTFSEENVLELDSYGSIHTDKVLNALNEYKHRFDIKNSTER